MRILIGKTATFVQILYPMHMNCSFLRLILVAVAVVAVSCQPRDRYVVFSGYAQGGTWSVKANMKGVEVKDRDVQAALDSILLQIDNSLSGYNRNSLLSAFNAGESIVPDTFFLDIYGKAADVYDVTGGCVDPASAPLFDMWGFGFKSGEMPSSEKVGQTLSGCGMKRLERDIRKVISSDGKLASCDLLLPGFGQVLPQLNYNAIAQGYSCDCVASYLYSIGVKDMMVDIGEIFCDGVNPSGRQWTIGIDSPVDGNNNPGENLQAIFKVPSGPRGVVTSGNYRKFYVKDGRKYAHTIDPRTGYPVSHSLLSATVLASDATLADAYATYCMVIGLEESKNFIASTPDVEGCLIYDDGGEFKVWASEGFLLGK
jgi:thiamine biosynthesis lipoprotein